MLAVLSYFILYLIDFLNLHTTPQAVSFNYYRVKIKVFFFFFFFFFFLLSLALTNCPWVSEDINRLALNSID